MKLDHLSFAQLYKLAHHTTLLRVTAAYHGRLIREWDEDTCSLTLEPFTVAAAKVLCPEIAARYERVLAFLRGPVLKAALRKAAVAYKIPFEAGQGRVLCRLPLNGRNPRAVWAHANVIYTFCKLAGSAVDVVKFPDSYLAVVVYTTPVGVAALLHRPGLKWKTIKHECAIENTHPWAVFPWLNYINLLTDDDRMNPAVWPVNTPDVAAVAESLVTRVATN